MIGKAAATAIGCDGSDCIDWPGRTTAGGMTQDNNTEARWPQPTAAAVKFHYFR